MNIVKVRQNKHKKLSDRKLCQKRDVMNREKH